MNDGGCNAKRLNDLRVQYVSVQRSVGGRVMEAEDSVRRIAFRTYRLSAYIQKETLYIS